MDIYKIEKYPEKVLRANCRPVEGVTERERDVFQKMLRTMYRFDGIGLAAPQVGISEQIIVADIGEGAVVLANPRIIKKEGRDDLVEGCLSIPSAQVHVTRSYTVTVEGINDKGEYREIKVKGLLARVLQHEMDHLEGKLIIDYLPWWERVNLKMCRKHTAS